MVIRTTMIWLNFWFSKPDINICSFRYGFGKKKCKNLGFNRFFKNRFQALVNFRFKDIN